MTISASIQGTLINAANNFVIALYDDSSLTNLLDFKCFPKPYVGSMQYTFNYNCRSGHIYNIVLFESVNTSANGVKRNSYSQTVNQTNVSVSLRANLYLQVDTSDGLISGTNAYVDNSLVNWEWVLFRNRQLQTPSTANIGTVDYTPNTSGFTLLGTDKFESGEVFTIEFKPQLNAVPVTGIASGLFSDGEIITTNKTLDTTNINKALLIQAASTNITVTLPPILSVTDYDFIYLYSFGGNHLNAIIKANGTDNILFNTNINQIILGQCEFLKLFKAFGKWNVENDLAGVKNVGEVICNFSNTEINTLQCKGQLVNRIDYPRLWGYVQNLSNGVTSDNLWSSTTILKDGMTYYPNKCMFSAGDGSLTFRLPLLTGMVFKGVDGITRMAGSFESEQIISHTHNVNVNPNANSQSGSGKITTGGDAPEGTIPPFISTAPMNTDGSTMTRVGTKNLIDNVGLFALIRI